MSRLSPAEMTELFAERGGDPERPGKKDPLDPLVWLAARPGEPAWAVRLRAGRPGWHVECAAIATEYLGIVFDIQAGGSDLAFPHHEMSALHARAALRGAGDSVGPAFARVYAHAGMVRLQGEKMSKSLGNLVFVSRLLRDGADPMAVRLAILGHHYRQDWDWTEGGLRRRRRGWTGGGPRWPAPKPHPRPIPAIKPSRASEAVRGWPSSAHLARWRDRTGRAGPGRRAARLRDTWTPPGRSAVVDRGAIRCWPTPPTLGFTPRRRGRCSPGQAHRRRPRSDQPITGPAMGGRPPPAR